MAAVDKVLVIGGGVGGLAAARAMRLRGIQVDLIEKEPIWTVYGVGIIQPINVLRALETIGVARQCVNRGGPFQGWRVCDADGNVMVDAPHEHGDSSGLPNLNGITRPILHEILIAGAITSGVDIRLGVTASDFREDRDGIDVSFTDNETRRYDLVVGFDGVYSKTRRFIFGDSYEPKFTGQGTWRYNLPRPSEVDTGAIYYGPDTKIGLCPLAPSKMYMFLVTEEADGTWYNGPGLADEMRSRIKGYSGLVERLREQIVDPAQVVYRPMLLSLIDGPWYKGRIVIAGDAAHATTPHLAQGAAMAIEDGIVLAEALGMGGSLESALGQFMTRRFERVKYVVDSSLKIGRWELESWHDIHDPEARLGPLLHEASVNLAKGY